MAHVLDRRATCFAVKRQVRSELLRDANQRLRERLFSRMSGASAAWLKPGSPSINVRPPIGISAGEEAPVGMPTRMLAPSIFSIQTTPRTLCNSLRLVEVRKGQSCAFLFRRAPCCLSGLELAVLRGYQGTEQVQ